MKEMIIRIWKKWFGKEAGQVKNEQAPKVQANQLSMRLEKFLMKHYEVYYALPPTHDVFFQCFRLPKEGETHQLHTAYLYSSLAKRFPKAMRGMNANQFGKLLVAIGAERVHTAHGNVYRVVAI